MTMTDYPDNYDPYQATTCDMCHKEVPYGEGEPWIGNPNEDPDWICSECVEAISEPCNTCGDPVLPGSEGAWPLGKDGTGPYACEACVVTCDGCDGYTSPAVAVSVDGDNAAPWLCPACVADNLKQTADDAASKETESDSLHM
jgi:hypothetical protein